MKCRHLTVGRVVSGIALLLVVGLNPLGIGAQSPNRVGLVVRLGDGSVITRCVEFVEDELSGYDVLMRSGLQVVVSQPGGMGVIICQIGGEGCPANNCFCKCSGSTCNYWSYWRFQDDAWSYSPMGASGNRVRPGAVEGWVWGRGDPPPVLTLEQICALPATATPPPTATPTVFPTATAPLLTPTPQPAGRATVLATATWTSTAVPPTASLALLPLATHTSTLTPEVPAVTLSPTFSPQSPRATPASESRPDPALRLGQETPSSQNGDGRSNYVWFGVLAAMLLGVAVLLLRKR